MLTKQENSLPSSPVLYFLPKSATKCIVTYTHDDAIITAVCPAHTKTVATAYILESGFPIRGSATLDIPELYMSHRLMSQQFYLMFKSNHFIPYGLANVYDYGVICFGDVFDRYPRDLRQAWNYYWESPFNQENSGYIDYHQLHCMGVVSHNYAGHRDGACICACCLNICNCACHCDQGQLFNNYLKSYKPIAHKSAKLPPVETADSLVFEVRAPKLLILPKSYAVPLGLKDYKYPDIYVGVTHEDENCYYGSLLGQAVTIPKEWAYDRKAK